MPSPELPSGPTPAELAIRHQFIARYRDRQWHQVPLHHVFLIIHAKKINTLKNTCDSCDSCYTAQFSAENMLKTGSSTPAPPATLLLPCCYTAAKPKRTSEWTILTHPSPFTLE